MCLWRCALNSFEDRRRMKLQKCIRWRAVRWHACATNAEFTLNRSIQHAKCSGHPYSLMQERECDIGNAMPNTNANDKVGDYCWHNRKLYGNRNTDENADTDCVLDGAQAHTIRLKAIQLRMHVACRGTTKWQRDSHMNPNPIRIIRQIPSDRKRVSMHFVCIYDDQQQQHSIQWLQMQRANNSFQFRHFHMLPCTTNKPLRSFNHMLNIFFWDGRYFGGIVYFMPHLVRMVSNRISRNSNRMWETKTSSEFKIES